MRLLKLLPLLGLVALGYAAKCPKQKTSPGKEILCYTSGNDVDELKDSICRCTTLVHQGHQLHNLSTNGVEELQKSAKDFNPSIQIVVSVNDPQGSLRTSATTRHEAAARLARLLSKVDGVELDMNAGSKERMSHFVKGLKDEMVRKSNEKRILLALPTKTENLVKQFDLKALSKHVDLFTLTTHYLYDENESFTTFHPSRLMGMFDMLNTDSLVDLISGLGAPRDKLVISLPASAYKFTLKNNGENAPRAPTEENEPVAISHKELCELMSKGEWTVERDEDLTAPYAFKDDTWIAFEDKTSVGIKGKYVLLRELAGLGIHNVEHDLKNKCGKPVAHEVYHSFTDMKRKTRGAVLASLEDDIHRGEIPYSTHVKSSGFRIVRVVDTAGAIHAIRENTQTEFSCTRQGYFVHPKSCNRFYRCVKFNQGIDDYSVFEFDCPAGLAFDERTEVCVWPGSLPEGSPCPGSSEIAPVPRAKFQCPDHAGYFADPQNCRWFFACFDLGGSELTAYEFRCPFGLVFDEEKLICEWPWLVPGCGVAGYSRTEYGSAGYGIGSGAGVGSGSTASGSGYSGAGSGNAGYSGVGSGNAGYSGAGSGIAAYSGAGSGNAGYSGAGSGNAGYSGAGSGNAGYSGAGSGNAGYSGAGSGNAGYPGAGSGSAGYSGAGSGNAGYSGAGSGSAGYSGTGSGNAGYSGAGSGNAGYSGAGSGNAGYSGAGSGNAGYSGAGSGSAGYTGAGSGNIGYSGAGAGSGNAGYSDTDSRNAGYSGAGIGTGNAGYSGVGSGAAGYSKDESGTASYSGAGTGSAGYSGAGSGNAGYSGDESVNAGYSGLGSTGAGSSGAYSGNTGNSGVGSTGSRYSGTKSTNAGYSGTGSTGSRYSGAGSTGASYSGTGSTGSRYSGAGSTGGGYSEAASTDAGYSGASSTGSRYSGAGSTGASYSGTGSTGSRYSGASSTGAGYSGASSTGAGYSGASSTGAGYSGASSTGAGYSGASSTGAGYSGAGSTGTGITGSGYSTSVKGAILTGIPSFTIRDQTVRTDGSTIHDGRYGTGTAGIVIESVRPGFSVPGSGLDSPAVFTGTTGSDYAVNGAGESGSHYVTGGDSLNGHKTEYHGNGYSGGYVVGNGANEAGVTLVDSGVDTTGNGYLSTGSKFGSSTGNRYGSTGSNFDGTTGSTYVSSGSNTGGTTGSGYVSTGSKIGFNAGKGSSYGATTYHGNTGTSGNHFSIGGAQGGLITGNNVHGAVGTGDSDTGTVLTHGDGSGTILTGTTKQGAVYANGGKSGYVETQSGTSGYVVDGGVKTIYGGATAPGTLVTGTAAPGVLLTGTSAPGVIIEGDGTPGAYVSGQVAQGVGLGGTVQPGVVVGGSTGNAYSGGAAVVTGSTTYHGNNANRGSYVGTGTTGNAFTGTSGTGYFGQTGSTGSGYTGSTGSGHTGSTGSGYTGSTGSGYTGSTGGEYTGTTTYGNKGSTASGQSGGYETNEYHDNGGRGTIRYNNGYITSKYAESDLKDRRPAYASLPDTIVSGGRIEGSGGVILDSSLAGIGAYTKEGFTKSGATKTGYTTAQLGGSSTYVVGSGRPRPRPNSEKIGTKAFEGSVGYTGGVTVTDVNNLAHVTSTVAPDTSYVDTSKITLGPSTSGVSSGYSYSQPGVQYATDGLTASTPSPFSVTYQQAGAVAVTTPSPHLNVEVYNTPSIVTSAPITAAPAVVNTYSYRKPANVEYQQTLYQAAKLPTVSTGYAYSKPVVGQQQYKVTPTVAPVAYTTRPLDTYRTTLYEAAKLPVPVSTVAPVIDNGYRTVVSSSVAPISVTTGQYTYKDSRFQNAAHSTGQSYPDVDVTYRQPDVAVQKQYTYKDSRYQTARPNLEIDVSFQQPDSSVRKQYVPVTTAAPVSVGYTYEEPSNLVAYNVPVSTPAPQAVTYRRPAVTVQNQVNYGSVSTAAPVGGITYKQPAVYEEYVPVSTASPVTVSQGYSYPKPTVQFVSTTPASAYKAGQSYSSQSNVYRGSSVASTAAGGSPTNLGIPRGEVRKLVTNYERGNVKYTPNVYDTYSSGDLGPKYVETSGPALSTGYEYNSVGSKANTHVSSTASPIRKVVTPAAEIATTYSGGYRTGGSYTSGYSTGYSTTPSYSVSTVSPIGAHDKPKIVVKFSDLHPLLLGKLGAQCTCRNDPLEILRGPARKSLPIKSSNGPVDLANYDESDIYVEIDDEKALGQSGLGYGASYGSSTSAPLAVSTYRTPVTAVFGANRPINALTKSRGRPTTYSSSTASPVGTSGLFNPVSTVGTIDGGHYGPSDRSGSDLGSDAAPSGRGDISIVPCTDSGDRSGKSLGAFGTESGERSGKSLGASVTSAGNAIGGQGAAFDRYGPGGWRGVDETLQGSTDCARPGLFRHPKYCNKFYACHWDEWKEKFTLHVFNCPVHLSFDSSAGACNWPTEGPACQDDNLLV